MTIKQIENLRKDEKMRMLRYPQHVKGKTKEELWEVYEQFFIIVDKIIRNNNQDGNVKDYLNSMYAKRKLKKCGISKIKPLDESCSRFQIVSQFGKGLFSDARKMFVNGEYPEWIKTKKSFSNNIGYILRTKTEARVLSGIAYLGNPFLHSVLLVGDDVVDFSYDLMISKDIYFALTHFEVLEEIGSDQILLNREVLKNINGVKNFVITFAFKEVLENEKAKLEMVEF
jgi:hypothetical protein